MSTGRTVRITITEKQQLYLSWTTDVLVYIVVLNLFVEFVEAIVIDSFWISILTAVLLRALLGLVVRLEHRVDALFEERRGSFFRFLGLATKFLILFASKFFILEVVSFVFGEHVKLGHFVEIVALIVAMIVAKAVMVRIYKGLGQTSSPERI